MPRGRGSVSVHALSAALWRSSRAHTAKFPRACLSFALTIKVSGNVLGTITVPCGVSSSTLTFDYKATNNVQVHRHVTGTTTDLTVQTTGESIVTAGFNMAATIHNAEGAKSTLTCV